MEGLKYFFPSHFFLFSSLSLFEIIIESVFLSPKYEYFKWLGRASNSRMDGLIAHGINFVLSWAGSVMGMTNLSCPNLEFTTFKMQRPIQ